MSSGLADEIRIGSGTCPSQEELRQYLNGWMDDDRVLELELHTSDCADCQQFMREGRIAPDTLLQTLQSTIDSGRGSVPAPSDSVEQPILDAIERVKQLVDKPVVSSAERHAWQPAQREIGVYDLQRPLGRGGMGAVYLATHRQLRKQVAIKLLPILSAEDSDVRARFDREIRVVGKLNHPSIVAATDAGEVDGTQFLVMEYVPGMDLSRLARAMGRLSVPDACELMRQTALGLSCAHAEGVVHRDVKPSNLMLDETGRIRILDFGLAQLNVWDEVSIDLTTVGQLMGTLDYMAPEQAEITGGVDYRADLYALGATLFRLLCGRPPLAAAPNQSPLEKLRLLANHQPPRLSTLCPDAPDELVSLVSSLLARRPQDRPVSAAHVAEQLAPFTAGADLPALLKHAENAAPVEQVRQVEQVRHIGRVGPVRHVRRWLLLSSFVPLLIVAGILIKLELDKGHLVIESEVANVHVTLLRDGQPVDGIQVAHGTTSTRLKADKYEITIDGPSDGLQIDKNEFALKNGETVVARIRTATPDAMAGDLPGNDSMLASSSAPSPSNEPLYDGKPLEHWLEMLSREKSAEGLGVAFASCDALLTPENRSHVADVLLGVLPSLDGVQVRVADGSLRVDSVARDLLRKALPGSAYCERWITEYEAADTNWRDRLSLWYAPDTDFSTIEAVEPFVRWAERKVQADVDVSPDVHPDLVWVADRLRFLSSCFSTIADESFKQRLSQVLIFSPRLDDAWWLNHPLTYQDNDQRQPRWAAPIHAETIRRAVQAFQRDDTPPSLAIQACMILSECTDLDAESKSIVIAALKKRLGNVCQSDEEFTRFVTTPDTFSDDSHPMFDDHSPLRTASIVVEFRPRIASNIPALEQSVTLQLLRLAATQNQPGLLEAELKGILSRCQSTFEIVHAQRLKLLETSDDRGRNGRGFGHFGNEIRLSLLWPDLTVSSQSATLMSGGGFGTAPGVSTSIQLANAFFWGDHEPTKADWLKYLVLLHPIMRDSVTAAIAEQSAGESDATGSVDPGTP